MNSLKITHSEVATLACKLALELESAGIHTIYPVPRGGVFVAYALKEYTFLNIVDDPKDADAIVDDIIDSGVTRAKYSRHKFYALITKSAMGHAALRVEPCTWVTFPWESDRDNDRSADDIGTRLLQYIGEDPSREGLQETPARFLKAWRYWTKGYSQDPKDLFKVFEDGAEGCDEMIVVKDIPLYSHCEHHLAAIIGTASVAYIPSGKIIGLSKIARVVDMYARRLQVQERLTNQIADCLEEHLNPLGVAVTIKARHLCMESRGVEKPGAETVTSALRGSFRTESSCRAEFYSIVKG